jgi:hypothetical protein
MQLKVVFLSFVAAVIVGTSVAALRYMPRRYRAWFVAGFGGWVVAAATLGLSGSLAGATLRPPATVYVIVPTIAIVAFLARSRAGAAIASSIPIAILMGAESFRVIVEIFLERLWHAGQLPRMLTFHGANFDIFIGISAPVVAALYARNAIDARAALIWNVVGIASLANVVARNVLTSPAVHLLSAEVPNVAIGSFPYSFIPTLIVPLALLSHVLAIRSLSGTGASARGPIDGPNLHVRRSIASSARS